MSGDNLGTAEKSEKTLVESLVQALGTRYKYACRQERRPPRGQLRGTRDEPGNRTEERVGAER